MNTYELDTLVKLLSITPPEHNPLTIPIQGSIVLLRGTTSSFETANEPRGERKGSWNKPFYLQLRHDRLSVLTEEGHYQLLTAYLPVELERKGEYIATKWKGELVGVPTQGELWIKPEQYFLGTRYTSGSPFPQQKTRDSELL